MGETKVQGRYDRFRRVVFQIAADSDAVGGTAGIWDGERCLGEAHLVADDHGSSATLETPMPPIGQPFGPLTLRIDGEDIAPVELPDADEERRKAFESVELHFAP